MNVLMFGWEFPPAISGGLGTACLGLSEALSGLGARITFVLPKAEKTPENSPVEIVDARRSLPGQALNEFLLESLEWERVPITLRPYLNAKGYAEYMKRFQYSGSQKEIPPVQGILDISEAYGGDLLKAVSQYARFGAQLASRKHFHVIHAHDWMTFPAGALAKQKSGRPFVAHVHSTEFDRSGDHPNTDIYKVERFGMEQADKIIAVSHRTKDCLIHRYGIDKNKIAVIHNGTRKEPIEVYKTVKKFREKIVLFLGRITFQKGPDYFLQAAEKVLKQTENARFVMAGSGDMIPRMIAWMASLRLEKKFHFTGFLQGEQREKIFAMSDIYVMPSVSEPFGITPLEVMRHGKPVILSKQSGVAEVLNNVQKVDFWDIQKLSEKIMELLSRPDLAHSIGQNGANEVSEMNWSPPAAKVWQLYHACLSSIPMETQMAGVN